LLAAVAADATGVADADSAADAALLTLLLDGEETAVAAAAPVVVVVVVCRSRQPSELEMLKADGSGAAAAAATAAGCSPRFTTVVVTVTNMRLSAPLSSPPSAAEFLLGADGLLLRSTPAGCVTGVMYTCSVFTLDICNNNNKWLSFFLHFCMFGAREDFIFGYCRVLVVILFIRENSSRVASTRVEVNGVKNQ
jgi:hypothetical protein